MASPAGASSMRHRHRWPQLSRQTLRSADVKQKTLFCVNVWFSAANGNSRCGSNADTLNPGTYF